jgi:hypothetical protein
VSATRILFTSSGGPLANGASRSLVAELRTDTGEVDLADNSTQVTFAQVAGDGTLTGLGTVTVVAGIATLSVTASAAGSVTVEATSDTALPAVQTSFMVAGAASSLHFVSDVSALAPPETRSLVVEARDDNGTVDPTYTGNVTFALDGTSTGTLTGLGTVAAVAGVATLTVTAGALGTVIVNATGAGLAGDGLGDTSTFAVASADVAPVVPVGEYDPHTWTDKEAASPSPERMNALEQTLSEVVVKALGTESSVEDVVTTLEQILALAITLRSAELGSRVEIDADGIRLYGPDGDLVVNLDTFTGSGTFEGDVLAHNLQMRPFLPAIYPTFAALDNLDVGDASYVGLTPLDQVYLSGIAGGTPGRQIVIANLGAPGTVVWLVNEEDGTPPYSSDAENCFHLFDATADDLAVYPGASVTVQYDADLERWRAIGGYGLPLGGDVNTSLTDPFRVTLRNIGGFVTVAGANHAALTTDQNNFVPSQVGPLIGLEPTGDRKITGLSIDQGTNALQLLMNAAESGGGTIRLTNQDTASLDANRFDLPRGQDLVLAPQEGVLLLRMQLTSSVKWRVVAQSRNRYADDRRDLFALAVS